MGRRLYGRLLIAFPGLEALRGAWEFRSLHGERLGLEVIGCRERFRRIELIRLIEDELGDLIPAPRVEFVVSLDRQCAVVTQYEDAILSPIGFSARWEEHSIDQPRIVIALISEFLDNIAGAEPLLVADGGIARSER